jgi:hypothetical protein
MRPKSLLLLLLVVGASLISFRANAQTPRNTFIITAKSGTPEAEKVAAALEQANFNDFRLRNTHRILKFDNGVVVELLSATEMKALGYQIDPSFYPEALPAGYIEPTYSISESGTIMQNVTPNPNSKH